MTAPMIPEELRNWLAQSADGIDLGTVAATEILPRLAAADLPRIGVAPELGGAGGSAAEVVQTVISLARESLAAAFMFWGHRCYAEFLVQSENTGLRERQLPDILAGRIAGASALSNAMKFLSGLEPLQIQAREEGDTLVIDGKMPWVTNLRKDGFHVAAAADRIAGGPAMIVALSHDDPGLQRSEDLSLLGMRSSDTAAVALTDVHISRDRIIAENAPEWLPRLRPLFVGMQCGMAIGLAERALDEAATSGSAGRGILAGDIALLREDMANVQKELSEGLVSDRFVAAPARLFELRIRLSEIVASATGLELQAGGGRCYLSGPGRDFARRWREAAFIPLVTPNVVQLRTALESTPRAA
jgi:alkylation response protein AidB-like acyl-CoA dehydrogenase